MLRDNRGRFIRKALGGTSLVSPTNRTIMINGKQRDLLPGYEQAFEAYTKNHGTSVTLENWLQTTEGSRYLKSLPIETSNNSMIVSGVEIPLEEPTSTTPPAATTLTTTSTPEVETSTDSNPQSTAAPATTSESPGKIQYYLSNGKRFDINGNPISDEDFAANEVGYQIIANPEDPSAGMHLFDDEKKWKLNSQPINRERLSSFLDFARAGLGASINNKIADRALESEKPLLQDVTESHRSVFGNYRAKVQGEQAAAKLRNLASKPLTSDGALQQQMMLEAQIQGQQYIDQGNAADEEMIRQTKEVAWQQNKENQLQRQAVAMQNRQAMLMTEKNKTQIKNMRDSANYSQIVAPLLTEMSAQMRAKAQEQEYWQDYYDEQMVQDEVWHTYTEGLTPSEIELVNAYNSGTLYSLIAEDSAREQEFYALQSKMNQEIMRRLALKKGVRFKQYGSEDLSGQYGWFGSSSLNGYGGFYKDGGKVYRAKLTKRTRDDDRTARSIEANQKRAAKLLEKAMDSLYTYESVELIAKPGKKRKRRKYQAGGALPFVSYTPTFSTSEVGAPKAQPTSKKESDEGDLTTKDILELLEGMDPIPIDIAVISEEMRKFNVLDRINPNKVVSSADLASRYLQILTKVKLAKFNRDEYDNAFSHLKENGGLNELAVTSTGAFIASDGAGDFKEYTADEINAGLHEQEGFRLMTNSNLLYERSTNPSVALRHELIHVAQSGIGMEVITQQINEILQNLGTTKTQEEGFVQMGANGQVKSGLQFLQKAAEEIGDDSIAEAMSIADYYQAGYLSEDQAQQAELALQYIYSALPVNARALLQVKGGSPDGAVNLIKSLVYSKTKSTKQFKATPKKMATASSSSSGGSGGDTDKLKLSPVQMMQLGYTDHTEVTLQKGTKYAVKTMAQVLPLYDVNKEGLGVTTLDRVASSTFGGALDMNNVTMGGQLVDPHAMHNVQIDATNLYVMNLPIDKNSPDGTVKPDLAWLQKIEAIDKTIRDQGITDIDTINALYVEAGLPVLMDDRGQLNTKDYCKFGVLNGHALNTAFRDLDALDDTMVEIEDEDQIENVMRVINAGKSEKDRIDFDSKGFWDFLPFADHDSLFEGTVYIPIRTNPFTGMMGGGQYPTAEEAAKVEALVQQQERTRGYVDPGLLTE